VLAATFAFAREGRAQSFAAAGSFTGARELATATLLPTGQVLVAGGIGAGTLSSAQLYNASTNTWSSTASLANKRLASTATLLPSGLVLVAGGSDNSGSLSSAELYNSSTQTWSPAGSLATARNFATATLLPSGLVLVAGGYATSGAPLSSAELYNPATNAWLPTGSLASARGTAVATLLPSGQVLVAGGYGTGGPLGSAELYNPTTRAWSSAGSLATARYSGTETLLLSGQVLVAGGCSQVQDNEGDCADVSTAELYNPTANTWSPTGSLATARDSDTATLLPSGQVLVAGGKGSAGYLSSAELYVPPPLPTPAMPGWADLRRASALLGASFSLRRPRLLRGPSGSPT
jgi:N-acetylneuraminic acid mutarotase